MLNCTSKKLNKKLLNDKFENNNDNDNNVSSIIASTNTPIIERSYTFEHNNNKLFTNNNINNNINSMQYSSTPNNENGFCF